MSNQWLRLWHDLPNDPKWRTIARLSKQPISLVISTYIHLLVTASQNVTRGHADVTTEDLASALDVDESQIKDILDAMEGRVINDGNLTGWDKRQVKKEDKIISDTGVSSAAMRKREQRAREKENKKVTTSPDKSQHFTECHAESHDVTTDKIREDKDKNKEIKKHNPKTPERSASKFSQDAKAVFDYWVSEMAKGPSTKFTKERHKRVVDRLKSDYSVSDIKLAIDGCKKSDFHMGREHGKPNIYNDLELICRDDTHLEKFISKNQSSGVGGSSIVDAQMEFVGEVQEVNQFDPDGLVFEGEFCHEQPASAV